MFMGIFESCIDPSLHPSVKCRRSISMKMCSCDPSCGRKVLCREPPQWECMCRSEHILVTKQPRPIDASHSLMVYGTSQHGPMRQALQRTLRAFIRARGILEAYGTAQIWLSHHMPPVCQPTRHLLDPWRRSRLLK